MAALALAVLIAFIAVANAFPSQQPMEDPDLFQGDILLDDEDRNAVPIKKKRWPGGILPYVIDDSLAPHASQIRDAMDHIEKNTCVKFVPRQSESDYLRIFSGKGCFSYWGYVAKGEQPVSLSTEQCIFPGVMIHELMHAVGFDHEQNRSDRDQYLTIHYENIKEEAIDQFNRLEPWLNTLITPFDYDSIMIYGEYAFSKNGLRTMVPRKAGVTLLHPDKKSSLTASDIKRVNILYECPKRP